MSGADLRSRSNPISAGSVESLARTIVRCSRICCMWILLLDPFPSPESQGVVSGVVFVIVIIFLQLAYATDNRVGTFFCFFHR